MANPVDGNRVPTLKAALNTDGVTIVNVVANPTTHVLGVSDGTTGSDFGVLPAKRNADRIPVLLAVSSSDYETPVEVYADSNGNLLVDSM